MKSENLLSKNVDISENSVYTKNIEHTFATKGETIMSETEQELITLIRENDNPEQALLVAIDVILSFLAQPESSPEPSVACSPEPA